MNPADPREVGIEGAFFQNVLRDFKPSELGHYPLHWVSHIMHGLEVVGYCNPDSDVSDIAKSAYYRIAHSLHLIPETKEEMTVRLIEDRIASNTVVS
jgi:hypothetical protein